VGVQKTGACLGGLQYISQPQDGTADSWVLPDDGHPGYRCADSASGSVVGAYKYGKGTTSTGGAGASYWSVEDAPWASDHVDDITMETPPPD
jgi:hypothetical protein